MTDFFSSSWLRMRRRVAPLVAGALLLAGCTSHRTPYRHTTGRSNTAYAAVQVPAAAEPAATAESVAVPAAPTPAHKPAARHRRSKARQLAQVVAADLRQRAPQPAPRLLARAATQAHTARRAPHQAHEVGLGTTVLGVLGLVLLPLSLLGLLIWGGPVWAVLAGLAALAVLVAYLDPFA